MKEIFKPELCARTS